MLSTFLVLAERFRTDFFKRIYNELNSLAEKCAF